MSKFNRKSSRESQLDSYEDEFDSESESDSSRLRQRMLISELIGRWHWIILGLILGVLSSFYYLSKAPKIYQATSSLLVKQGASTLISGDESEDMNLRTNDGVNTLAVRVKRLELLTAVASLPEINELEGLIPEKTNWLPAWSQQWFGKEEEASSSRPQSAAELGKLIGGLTEAQVRRGTRLLDITVEHPIPEIAQKLADAIANEYIAELSENRLDGRDSSSRILTENSEEARLKLQAAENAKANYQQVLETLKSLEAIEADFNDLNRRYLAKHPKLIGAKARLVEFQDRFLSEFELVRKAPADKEYWNNNQSELDQSNSDVTLRLQIARRLIIARATVLQSEIQSQNEVFNAILTKIQETDINRKSTEAEVELSSFSELPGHPSSPKKLRVLRSGSILGFGSGLLLAFILVKLDNKFHTVGQIELLCGLPILATIQNIDLPILKQLKAENEKKLKVSDPSGIEMWDPRLIFRPALLQTLYAEAYRILRASVTLLGKEEERKITLFSSAIPGEGKTTTSANFAIAAAQQGKKTILIDFDLRKPAVHKAFGYKRKELSTGLTEVLTGKTPLADAIQSAPGQENFFILFSGKKAPNPGELLTTEGVVSLLKELKEEFEVIVIDSAPLLAVPDTRLLVSEVDNFCLVVRAEHTPKGAVLKCLDMLRNDENEPSGIAVNDYQERTGFARKYLYKYGGYGGYGQYGDGSDESYGSYGSDDEEED